MNKPTVIIGASPNEERYSYKAAVKLKNYRHTVFPIGIREGNIEGEIILTNRPQLKDIDTVTLYVGPQNQPVWYDYILSLKPKRLIFNPGAENEELFDIASSKGVECLEACTLVMLSIGSY